jgi:molybdopterin synthase sulfur carrier subunit
METGPGDAASPETAPVTVRYWASARAAAGVETDELPVTGPLSLADVVRRVAELHPGSPSSDTRCASCRPKAARSSTLPTPT